MTSPFCLPALIPAMTMCDSAPAAMRYRATLFLAIVLGGCVETPSRPKRASDARDSEAPAFGLWKRTAWKDSHVVGSPEPPPPYRAERLFPKIAFQHPVVATAAPGTKRLFVGEQRGKIFSISDDPNDDKPELFLDINGQIAREPADSPVKRIEALYGLTFHPNFAENRYCYVCYVVAGPSGQLPEGTRVSRFTVSKTDPPQCDPASEQLVIAWLQGGHNGGCLAFGKDGYLYISSGDGGFAFPPDGRKSGQDMSTLLSKVLRIDVDRPADGHPYSIPADNPFVGREGMRGETWCYGLRNPWKMSVDRETGDLWIADVGWELWELVFKAQRGGNYGWSIVEGRQAVHPDRPLGPTPILPPTIEVPHTDGVSITGGHVYRGKKFPELVGTYVFGDWETRRVWGAKWDDASGTMTPRQDLVDPTVRLVAFAEDNDGELLLVDYDGGTLHGLARYTPDATPPFPRRLSETGLFSSVADHKPAPGVVPFAINAEMWSDHATAERFVALPEKTTVKLHQQMRDVPGSMFQSSMDWPAGAVLVKTLSLPMTAGDDDSKRRLETQLLHFDGRMWRAYTYAWNDEQSDAELVEAEGRERTLQIADQSAPGGRRSRTWHYGSRVECVRCHNQWVEYALAFNLRQLALDRDYGAHNDSQLRSFENIQLVEVVKAEKPKKEFSTAPLSNPYDESADLNARARSYLHVNCAHCHRFNGGGSVYIQLQAELTLDQTKLLDVKPVQGTFDIADAHVVTAGDPYRSVLFLRMSKTGSGRMPHIGSEIVDERGVKVIYDWIRQLPLRTADLALVDKLRAMDEAAALEAEEKGAKDRRQKIAQRLANERRQREKNGNGNGDGSKTSGTTDADRAAAEETDLRETAERTAKRAKERDEVLGQLLSTTSRAMVLVEALRRNDLPASTHKQIVTVAAARPEAPIRDLFEAFLPEDQRVKRLGAVVNRSQLLALPGDAARGRTLFFDTAGIVCKNCHRIGETGGKLGPDLSQIGKKNDRSQLLESLLEPSKVIDPKYTGYAVELTDGRQISGLLVDKTEKELVVRDAKDMEHRLPLDTIEQFLPLRTSLMPELLLKEMTAEQVADLLAFLAGLGK